MELFLTFIPVILVIVMMVGFKLPGDISGVAGWIAVLVIACVFFNSGIDIGLIASAKGALASAAVTFMIVFALFQITYMQ